jgi:predicted transcriptional regulator
MLLKMIAIGNYHTNASIGKLNLTRKQYYARMSRLKKADLIKRKSGKYTLTSLGKVVFHCEKLIEIALNDYWKLNLIDGIKADDKIKKTDDYLKVMDTLIDNKEIKDIIFPEKQQAAHLDRSSDIELIHSMLT